ncbi:MAG: class I SAM-dependent methyltransferase [Selenomonadaceae bacterium]|nr:class I SAM-dependent methyltransferase [Selenomonadaceae bacterium]
MIKINEIPNNEEPRKKIMSKLEPYLGKTGPAMAPSESSFISSLLQVYRPQKILEVGIDAGGTTAIVLQVLEDMNMPYEMHSVDLAQKMTNGKDIGYLPKCVKENNLLITPSRSTLCGTHEFHLGKYLPQVIDKIGGDINFVILDTVHYTPGELLDFLVMLPYLKDSAIVVLHDVALNQLNNKYHKPDAHATGLLFSAVVAEEKFLNYEPTGKYPNIGAFRISKQTYDNIENVFLALMLTWHYLPEDDEITIYRNFYNRYYPAKLVEIFDETVRLNRNNIAFKK